MTDRTAQATEGEASRPLLVRQLGRLEYGAALALQERLVAAVAAGEAPEQVLLVEHDPVYTLGRGADAADLGDAAQRLGVPVFRVGRGGGATYHGPGQLVAYPIVRLRAGGRDVHGYVRALERALVATCDRLGVPAHLRDGLIGVWAGGGKIASIGIGVRRGVAYHGLALNVCPDLSYFTAIVPCRMREMPLTSLARELGSSPPMDRVTAALVACLAASLGCVILSDVGCAQAVPAGSALAK